MKEKKGKKLGWNFLNKRYLWNFPQKLLLFPVLRKIFPFTMLSYSSLCEMYDHINRVDKENIPGAIVEMGCWKGGCGALMKWTSEKNNNGRTLWLFDSFEGLPELAVQDKEWADKAKIETKKETDATIRSSGFYLASMQDVQQAIKSMGVTEENVKIQKGWFQNTVPGCKNQIGKIAILRLDGDIYESTKYCLEELYDLVSPGGVIVIDDYHLEGCRHALYEFFMKKNLYPYLQNNAYGGRAFFLKR